MIPTIEKTVGETRYEDDTKVALLEMNKLFRHLFPLVPDKAHYIWKASHRGGSLTLNQPQHHTTYIEHIENPPTIIQHSVPQSDSITNIRDEQQYEEVSLNAPTNPTPILKPVLANNRVIKYGRRMHAPPLGKRGPECMRKCIAQGVLHPVQCHSLC